MENIKQCKIWMRVGMFVSGDRKDIEKMIRGDKDAFARLMDSNSFILEGESYIPSICIDDYNEANHTDFNNDDVYFEL
jgi:hypothetical protein